MASETPLNPIKPLAASAASDKPRITDLTHMKDMMRGFGNRLSSKYSRLSAPKPRQSRAVAQARASVGKRLGSPVIRKF